MKSSFLALTIAAVALAQTASQKPSVDVRRVGARLACRCGCTDSVATCSMLECGSSKLAKETIAKMQAAGETDDRIVQGFLKQGWVYLSPPNALGWIVPYAAVGAGILIILAFIRKYRKPKPLTEAGALDMDNPELAKYKDEIERDLAKLE